MAIDIGAAIRDVITPKTKIDKKHLDSKFKRFLNDSVATIKLKKNVAILEEIADKDLFTDESDIPAIEKLLENCATIQASDTDLTESINLLAENQIILGLLLAMK